MIRVRDDDVLVNHSTCDTPELRFRLIHEKIVAHGAHHVPTILCGPIQTFPGTIRYLLEEMDKGTVTPELHGWDHVNYENFTVAELEADLARCVDWFNETFDSPPRVFYPPWGSITPDITAAAKLYGMKAIGTSDVLQPRTVVKSPNVHRGKQDAELFIHWWAGDRKLEPALNILNGDL